MEPCGLNGPVRAVREETTQYVWRDGGIAEKPSHGRSHAFDPERRLVESRQSYMGEETGRQAYAYDEAGDASEEAGYEGDGRLLFRTTFARERDEHGNWTSELVSAAPSWDPEPGRLTPRPLTRRRISYW